MGYQTTHDSDHLFADGKCAASQLSTLLKTKTVLLIASLATYLNTVAFGFRYGEGNHTFQLAMVNWLRDHSLYPMDPIRAVFAHYPSLFWEAVAYFSRWLDTRTVLWIAFLMTKLIFFSGLARLVAGFLKHPLLVTLVTCGLALSPFLNGLTPFAASDILSQVETHTSLAIALLVWVGCFLVERRWLSAAVILGLTVYVNGLFAGFMLFGLMAFALLDYREQKREILLAMLLLGAVALPSLWVFHGTLSTRFPADFVQTMLWRYPYHYRLLSHPTDELLSGVGILLAAAALVLVTTRLKLRRHYRLELLAGAFLIFVLLGAIAGELFPTPQLIILQPLRADSFLFLFSMVLIQVYGWNLLLAGRDRWPATTWLLGVSALLLPLFEGLRPLLFLSVSTLLALDPRTHFEGLCRRAAESRVFVSLGMFALVTGFVSIRLLGVPWSPTKDGLLMAAAILLLVYRAPAVRNNLPGLAAVVCGVAFVAMILDMVPQISSLWNPTRPLAASESAWREVQLWAKANSPPDTEFLVPPSSEGFRVLSERSEWVDWKDGQVSYILPDYTNEWRRRLAVVGIDVSGKLPLSKALEEYKQQSWECLQSVAIQNNIRYVIQYREMTYEVAPVFANQEFAVYPVDSSTLVTDCSQP